MTMATILAIALLVGARGGTTYSLAGSDVASVDSSGAARPESAER